VTRKLPILLLLFAALAHAQDAPFWTRQQVAGQSLNAALRATDAAQTCYHLREGWVEVAEPSQKCSVTAAITLGGIPASIGLSYLLHRAHHDRLAGAVPYLFASGSAVGITYSFWPRKGRK
jgi:hypothetical protein